MMPMALLMALERWLRLAFFQPLAPRGLIHQTPAATFSVAYLKPAPLAPIHAPPPDPGRWKPRAFSGHCCPGPARRASGLGRQSAASGNSTCVSARRPKASWASFGRLLTAF